MSPLGGDEGVKNSGEYSRLYATAIVPVVNDQLIFMLDYLYLYLLLPFQTIEAMGDGVENKVGVDLGK